MSILYDPWNRRSDRRNGAGHAERHAPGDEHGAPTPTPAKELDRTLVQTRQMRLGTSSQRSWRPSHPTPGASGLVIEFGSVLLRAIWFLMRLPFRRSNLRLRRTWDGADALHDETRQGDPPHDNIRDRADRR